MTFGTSPNVNMSIFYVCDRPARDYSRDLDSVGRAVNVICWVFIIYSISLYISGVAPTH